jgi:hypothetical protein
MVVENGCSVVVVLLGKVKRFFFLLLLLLLMRDPWPGQVSRPEMVEKKNLKKENSNQTKLNKKR